MRAFFDAIAEAHFVPDAKGTVRFVPSRIEKVFFELEEGDYEGLKLLWRPLVLLYILTGHIGLVVVFIEPWLGLPLILLVWLGRLYVLRELKLRFKRVLKSEEESARWISQQLAQSIERPIAIAVFVMAVTATLIGFFGFNLMIADKLPFDEPIGALCVTSVGMHWVVLFHGVITNQGTGRSRT